MKKTALQKLIEYMEENYHLTEESRLEFKKALKEEKQQILDAWVDGNDNEPKEVTNDFAEKYYNKTFNQ